MKHFFFILLLVLGFEAQDTRKEKEIPDDGLIIIEYNAPFNLSNSYEGFNSLLGVKKTKVCIEQNPQKRKDLKIKNVPTLILFLDNIEVYRWRAGLDMKIHTSTSDVQKVIDSF